MSLLSTVKDIDRLRQITQVLIKHGFGHLAVKMGLPGAVKKDPKTSESEDDTSSTINIGKRLRLTLQDLGTTFVKLGQIASTRGDLLPEEIVSELKKLQDDVKPFPTAAAKELIEEELGAKLHHIFESFDDTPIACASVAQVYRATLKVNEESLPVAVKVQRPGIDTIVERDIHLLHILARVLERSVPEAKIYSPTGLVNEFERAIKAEMDFIIEAQNAERFIDNFSDDDSIRFPKIYRRESSKRVLTLEFLDGLKVTDAAQAGANAEWIAENSVRIILKMVFEDGFFHADPHPGNIMILPRPENGRYEEGQEIKIGLLDLGLVGRLSPKLRDRTTDLLLAAARNDPDSLADAMLSIGKLRAHVDRNEFREYTRRVSERHLGKPLAEMEAAAILRDLIGGALQFQIEIPSELTMLFRAIMTIEGVGKEIHPELDVLAVAKPYLSKMIWQRYHPTRVANMLWRDAARLSEAARDVPSQISQIIYDLQHGNLELKTRDRQRSRVMDRLGRRIRATLLGLGSFGSGIALLIADKHISMAETLMIVGVGIIGLHYLWDWNHQRNDRP